MIIISTAADHWQEKTGVKLKSEALLLESIKTISGSADLIIRKSRRRCRASELRLLLEEPAQSFSR